IGVFTPVHLQLSEEQVALFRAHYTEPFPTAGLHHVNLKAASEALKRQSVAAPAMAEGGATHNATDLTAQLKDAPFAHLHNHTQFSVLQSTISIGDLVKATAKLNLPAVAM